MEGYIEATKQFTGKTIDKIHVVSDVSSNKKQGPDALAFCYEQLGDLEKASKRYEDIGAYITGAQSYEKIGNLEKALELLQKAVEIYGDTKNPNSVLKGPLFHSRISIIAKEELERIVQKSKSL